MKTELTFVTPQQAREWLKRNSDNRRLRPNVVEGLFRAWERGEWKPTHQGIAFGKNGRLLDGQHRLTFIGQLPDGTKVPINVSTNVDDFSFDAIDLGCGRTVADVYKVSAGLGAAGRYAAMIWNGSSTLGLTNQFIKPFIDWVQPEYEELTAYCPATARVWSSASVRTAAVFQMKRGMDSDFVKTAYHALIYSDVDQAPYAGRLLLQQYVSGKLGGTRTTDLFCSALRVFDSENNVKMARLRVDAPSMMEEVREWVKSEMKKRPGKAGREVAKPSLHSIGRQAG